ncbi:MAG: DUF4861 family protein [Paludibacteraceae bacterium]
MKITIKNPSTLLRNNELVELDFKTVKEKLALKEGEEFIIRNAGGTQIPYQITSNGCCKETLLLFPATVNGKGSVTYTITKGTPEKFVSKVYGRLVLERKDDFAWENDKIAFRVYGPALQATGEISSGIDVWVKRTENLVVNKWYANDLAGKQSYHNDNGEGLDMYKVGPTLGAGASTPWLDDKFWFSKNFVSCDVLDNGPLRMTVKLKYAPFSAGSVEVTETRIISLDAGSQLNKISILYEFNAASLPIVTGIVTRDSKEEKTFASPDSFFFLHAEPADKEHGTIYEAVVGKKAFEKVETKNNHILGFQHITPKIKYTYYQGAGWSKWGFSSFDDWKKYVADFSEKTQKPLIVKVK